MSYKTLLIEDHDLVMDSNMNFIIIEGKKEESQSLERALTTDINEWFLHDNHGLDYNKVFTRPFDEERARLEVISTIFQDPRVETVEKVDFEFINGPDQERLLMIHFIAKMKGDPNPIHVKIESNGYVVPVIDFEDQIEYHVDYLSLNEQTSVRIDLGFIVDTPQQRLDYSAIPDSPEELFGEEDFGGLGSVTEADNYGFYHEKVTDFMILGGYTYG